MSADEGRHPLLPCVTAGEYLWLLMLNTSPIKRFSQIESRNASLFQTSSDLKEAALMCGNLT